MRSIRIYPYLKHLEFQRIDISAVPLFLSKPIISHFEAHEMRSPPSPPQKETVILEIVFLYFLYESNFKQGRFWQCPWQTPYRSDISSWRERSPHSRRDVHRAEKQWTRSSPYRSYTESDPSGLCSLVSGKSVLFKNKILILHI